MLAYVAELADREAFAHAAMQLGKIWISNEHPQTFPAIAATATAPAPRGRFLLALNGHPVAWTDPHGAGMDWIGQVE